MSSFNWSPLLGGSGGSASPAMPEWRKYTVSYADLAAASTSNSIELFSLPALGVILNVIISQSASFTGGSISAYEVSVGVTGDLEKYASLFDVYQAPGPSVAQVTTAVDMESKASATSIKVQAVSTGANLNAATQGLVDIWVLWATLS